MPSINLTELAKHYSSPSSSREQDSGNHGKGISDVVVCEPRDINHSITVLDNNILHCYEDGMTLEEISDNFDLTLDRIVAVLYTHNKKFRAETDTAVKKTRKGGEIMRVGSTSIVSDERFDELVDNAFTLAMGADSENVKADLTKYLINERMGRNDNKNGSGNSDKVVQLNVILNQRLSKAEDKLKSVMDGSVVYKDIEGEEEEDD